MTQETEHSTHGVAHLENLLESGDTTMLVSKTQSGALRSRPMELVDINKLGELFFFTEIDSELGDELTEENHVNLSFIKKDGESFVSVSGICQLIREKSQINEHWKSEYARWVPGGLDNPSLTLLKVNVLQAEHWENEKSSSGLAQIFSFNDDDKVERHEFIAPKAQVR